LLATHYRSSLTFIVEGEDGSHRRVRGIEDARNALGRLRRALGPEPLDLEHDDYDEPSVAKFKAAMDADFNTPDALSVIFDLAREINTLRSQPPLQQAEVDRRRRTLVYLLDVLGIDLQATRANQQPSIEPYVDLLLDVRRKLRDIKQFGLADEVRNRLSSLGVSVEDKPGGESSWRIER